jgi:Carbohydrate-selective porin, OprB family/S-layer homology domain
MCKYSWRSLLLNATTLSCLLVVANQAIAEEDRLVLSDLNQDFQNNFQSDFPSDFQNLESEVDSLFPYSLETANAANLDGMAQVNSVFQLRDVEPRDWAFQALQNLVEKYNCLVGYPDGTFRGNRPLSRYEFAAGLNACLSRIETDVVGVDPDELAQIRALVQEFEAELATLSARVDDLEGRVDFLEDHQFSTTTKLNGLVSFNLTGAFAGDDVKLEAQSLDTFLDALETRQAGRDATGAPIVQTITDDPEITFSDLVWLTFDTSFTGKDSLVTQLAAGNGVSPANTFASAGLFNTFGVPFLDQTAGPEITGARNEVIIRELFYSFPVSEKLQLVVGPRINWYRYFDGNAFTFFLNGAGSFNSVGSTLSNTLDRGSGAIALWKISDKFKLNFGYLGENTEFLSGVPGYNTSSDPDEGLFGGTNSSTIELTYSPTSKINTRFFYNYSHINAINGTIGSAMGEPIYGIADAGPLNGLGSNPAEPGNGGLQDSWANTFGFNFDWFLTSKFGIFGRYTYGSTNLEPINEKINAQSIQAGFGLRDLGKKGAAATLSFLVPFDVVDGREFLAAGGGDGGTQYEIEANYYYPINNNISLVPSYYAIINPNNFDSNPAIHVFNIKTQISF